MNKILHKKYISLKIIKLMASMDILKDKYLLNLNRYLHKGKADLMGIIKDTLQQIHKYIVILLLLPHPNHSKMDL